MQGVRHSVETRTTKYVNAVLFSLKSLSHATNLEILIDLKQAYPDLSTTTVHRVTSRLKERGIIGCAPRPTNGSWRYDINPDPHNHFMCINCSSICDVPGTKEASDVINQLKNLSGECAIAGTLTLRGICKICYEKGKPE